MLDSILEFITQAASSSAFIFCFCNLIIVYILVDLKPSISIHQESGSESPLSMGANQKQGTNSKCLVQKDTQSQQVIQVSHVHEAEVEVEAEAEAKSIEVDNIETIGNDDCSNEEVEKGEEENDHEEDKEEEDEDADELRRRVEEFIKKVNKGWKEELLRTSRLA